jgi:putative chitinase
MKRWKHSTSTPLLDKDGLQARGIDCPDFEAEPDALTIPRWAALSAGWFWTDYKHLNALADAGDFERITRKINGGLNGQDDRVALFARAQNSLGVA